MLLGISFRVQEPFIILLSMRTFSLNFLTLLCKHEPLSSQEDVINTQCGYDIRAKTVSFRVFICNKRLILKWKRVLYSIYSMNRRHDPCFFCREQVYWAAWAHQVLHPGHNCSFSMFPHSLVFKIQQLPLHQQFGPRGITHAAEMHWKLKPLPHHWVWL